MHHPITIKVHNQPEPIIAYIRDKIKSTLNEHNIQPRISNKFDISHYDELTFELEITIENPNYPQATVIINESELILFIEGTPESEGGEYYCLADPNFSLNPIITKLTEFIKQAAIIECQN